MGRETNVRSAIEGNFRVGKILSTLLLLFLIPQSKLQTQPLTQTVSGQVLEEGSQMPIPGATVVIEGTTPVLGGATNGSGEFKIADVPVGRYDIRISSLGYEPVLLKEIAVSSGKEVMLTINLSESPFTGKEVVVKARVLKGRARNQTATTSGRMFSVEEASRYAGGFDDPARLASSFAGVASTIGNNGIVIRGNAPKSTAWRMEGVEISNPNHFANLSTFGGGGLTILSSHLLDNSDFFTGAFPAEYGNALSGIFDIRMRRGNSRQREHRAQIGLTGIDLASEGLFVEGRSSSYLFNYRYSTLTLLEPLLPDDAGGTTYQDLSFKLHFPLNDAGVLSLWGIGGIDGSGQEPESDSTKWFYLQDKQEQEVSQFMGATGMSYTLPISSNAFFRANLAASGNGIDLTTNQLDSELRLQPTEEIASKTWNLIFTSLINAKVGSNHTNRTGVEVTALNYDMLLRNAPTLGEELQTIVDRKGRSFLLSGYTNSTLSFGESWRVNVGVHGEFFTLNDHFTIEPRAGIRWQFQPDQALGLAYGLHSRLEQLNFYFARGEVGGEVVYPNKNLDFSKAHHLVLSYDLEITPELRLKVEPYIQYLFNVPIRERSSFSFINMENDWFLNDPLVNEGEGRNFGVDLTLEQFLKDGYYFLLTGSLFKSEYIAGDGIWRDTRFNRTYLLNLLCGKEWNLGEQNQNVLSISLRGTFQGGDRRTPVDLPASIEAKDVIYDESKAFSVVGDPSLLLHATLSFRVNGRGHTSTIALNLLNATGVKEFYGDRYNFVADQVEPNNEAIIIPNLSYKIEF
ncbi:MAG: TonB-dependent receptor [Ignavibacteriae bacterium]|nr:TonB-dependent receptor [Ignavibacteriota bacterium]MCB9214410.1 TonB-dependent receptor [Ignavibacteria bacterium]